MTNGPDEQYTGDNHTQHNPEVADGKEAFIVWRRSQLPRSMNVSVVKSLQQGAGPEDDGRGWLYRAFGRDAPPGSTLRTIFCSYYTPARIEMCRILEILQRNASLRKHAG